MTIEQSRDEIQVSKEEELWVEIDERYYCRFDYKHAPEDAQRIAEQFSVDCQEKLEEFQNDTVSRLAPSDASRRIRRYNAGILKWREVADSVNENNWDLVKRAFIEEGIARIFHGENPGERFGTLLIYVAASLPQSSTEE